ncbi:MAG TPA: hypothetical protein VFL97_05170 [Nitrococcus sp.]|nr:hypothetical protein [Nitrococcus sp.]
MADSFSAQPRSLQQYTRIVPAGGVEVLPTYGNFVFVRSTRGSVRIVMGGKAFDVVSGDYLRLAEGESFRDIELHNTFADPMVVTLVVGWGEFHSQIITGDVTVTPGVRRRDGTLDDDTRTTLKLFIQPKRGWAGSKDVNPGDIGPVSIAGVSYAGAIRVGRTVYAIKNVSVGAPNYNHVEVHAYDGNGSYKGLLYTVISPNFGGSSGHGYNAKTLTYHDGKLWTASEAANSGVGGVIGWDIATGLSRVDKPFSSSIVGPNGSAKSIAYDDLNDEFLFLTNPNVADFESRLCRFDTDWTLKEEIKFVPGGGMEHGDQITSLAPFDPNTLIVATINTWGYVDRATLTTTAKFSLGGGSPELTYDGVYIWACDTRASVRYLEQWEPAAGVETLRAVVTGGGCALGMGLIRPQDNRTMAGITTTPVGDGRFDISGPIIQAIIDLFRRYQPAADDYLDHVFGIEASGPGAGAFGAAVLSIQSGSKSFAAAGIADDFELTLPAQVTLTVDKGVM